MQRRSFISLVHCGMAAFAKGVLLFLAAFCVVATALPFVREPYWWVRMFDFPRLQLTILALVVLVLYGLVHVWQGEAGTLEWVVFALLTVTAAYQAVRMYPYSRYAHEQVVAAEAPDPARTLCLVVSNVLMDNRDAERWLRVVRAAEPDVIVTVETSAWWVARLRQGLGDYPHRVEVPLENTYGMAVYSRLPLEGAEVRHLVEPDVPSVRTWIRLRSGERVYAVFLHPRPPRPDIGQDATYRDAELILVAREVAEVRAPVVVAGDLNDVAWSHSTHLFQRLSRLLDPRVGRGRFSTFHADYLFLRWPLDHVFHSEHFALGDLRRLDGVGSDHFPILAELVLAPEQRGEQAPPEPEGAEHEEARERVEEAGEALSEESPAEAQERRQEDR